MTIRRVLVGVQNGKSVVLADGIPGTLHDYAGWPGHATAVIWATAASPQLPLSASGEPTVGGSVVPGPGETRLLVVRFPPDSIFAEPRFDGARYETEAQVHQRGLLEKFERAGNGFHRTGSIDYDVVLDGEITLELDDAVTVILRQGDVVVQGGARHAWRNRTNRPATMLFVLVGAAEPRADVPL